MYVSQIELGQNPPSPPARCRVLVVDDELRLQHEYRLAFAGSGAEGASDSYRSMEADLFGATDTRSDQRMAFQLTVCSQGEEAVAAVAQAMEAGEPFSVAFVDVRMPPGIDGVTAAERMARLDGDLNIVIVTGYSDVPRHEMHSRLGQGRFFYFQKPFLGEEFVQLAWALHCKREAEQQLRRANDNLQEEVHRRTRELAIVAQRALAANQAKSDFLANMSHELRTPLNAIIGFSDVIARQLFGPINGAHYVGYAKDVNSAAQHLLMIISDILDYSKIEAGEMELKESGFRIADVITFCRRLVQDRAIQNELSLEVRIAPNLPLVEGDETKVKQALTNLLSNAVKFTPVKGKVSIEVDQHGGDLRIQVRDNGIGMTPEQVARSLEPFRQVDSSIANRNEGTGLGLPLARALIELHGGSLTIESQPQLGTTVTLILPARRLISS